MECAYDYVRLTAVAFRTVLTLLTALTVLTADLVDEVDLVGRLMSITSTMSILSAVNPVNLVNAVNAVNAVKNSAAVRRRNAQTSTRDACRQPPKPSKERGFVCQMPEMFRKNGTFEIAPRIGETIMDRFLPQIHPSQATYRYACHPSLPRPAV